jgi:hypothetical protein
MKQALLVQRIGRWEVKIQRRSDGRKVTHRVRLAPGLTLKIHTTAAIRDWVVKFPWGGKMRAVKTRKHDEGLTEAKLRALTYVASSYVLALRTSKRLLRQLKNKRRRQ